MDTLYEKLRTFNAPRPAQLVELKYGAMAENAFRFFRGTCHLFYQRLSRVSGIPASPISWLCGDLHMENFGSYRADNGLVYFDLNDFDEAVLAPALWEVIRMVASIFVAFESLGIAAEQAQNMAGLFLTTYGSVLCTGKAVCIEPRTAKGMVRDFLLHSEKRRYEGLLDKRTESRGKKLMLSLEHERHFKLDRELKERLLLHIGQWIDASSEGPYNYKAKDVVFRLAGTGSVGARRYLFLLKSKKDKDHFILLDMKQCFASSLSPYIDIVQPDWHNEADRVLAVQKRLQCVPASLLSLTEFDGESYLISELQPMEDTFDYKLVKKDYRNLVQVIGDLASLTASAQLRSGGMDGSATIDELKRFGSVLGELKERVIGVARQMAEHNDRDYKAYIAGVEAELLAGLKNNRTEIGVKIDSRTKIKEKKHEKQKA